MYTSNCNFIVKMDAPTYHYTAEPPLGMNFIEGWPYLKWICTNKVSLLERLSPHQGWLLYEVSAEHVGGGGGGGGD